MHKTLITVLLLAAYPLAIHTAVVLDSPHALIIAPVFFALGILWQPLLAMRKWAWLSIALTLAVLAVIDHMGLIPWLLYLPPVAFPLLALVMFGRTLIRGREPLITHIGEVSRGPLSPAMRLYTRRLTALWCTVFSLLIVEGVLLPFYTDHTLWSLITNFINYGLVGGLFLGEFYYRKWRFPDHNHPSFIEYLHIIATTPPPRYGRDHLARVNPS